MKHSFIRLVERDVNFFLFLIIVNIGGKFEFKIIPDHVNVIESRSLSSSTIEFGDDTLRMEEELHLLSKYPELETGQGID